jgi:sugar/nucleoside kinase (ribokinase family)
LKGVGQIKMGRVAKPRIIVIGELNVDIVATGIRSVPTMGAEVLARGCETTLGSASAIFAAGVAKLGHAVTFVSQVGKDSFGDFCMQALQEAGVSVRNVSQKANLKTGVTLALSGAHDRALITYPGAIASLTGEQLNMSLIRGHQHIHLTSYYLQQGLARSFAGIFRKAKEQGLTTSFDPNSDPADRWRSNRINEVLSHTDVLFVNRNEALRLTGNANVHSALRGLGQMVSCAVIKLGRRGAMAFQNNKVFVDSSFRIKALDTTGSGDSFDAGFISAYLSKKPLVECLRVGNACGALTALQAGGTAGQPNRQQLQTFLRTHKQHSPRDI